MKDINIVIVGLGLIGGSLAKGIRPLQMKSLKGIDTSLDVISQCKDAKLIDNETETNAEILKDADLVFICLYPELALEFVKENINSFKSGALITDVIGLKENFMFEVEKLLRDDLFFVGGHPMAGKEGKGFSVSCEKIFKNANYLLVRSEKSREKDIVLLKEIIYKLGCKHVEVLLPIEHDKIITYTSHMPHILSSAFMSCDEFEKTKDCIAGSFRDFTRVSDINPDLWTELIMDNDKFVLEEILKFKEILSDLEQSIKKKENKEVYTFFENAKAKKQAIS